MAFQSWLFRGDPKLEAASTYDAAHIVQGAIGEHVRKIQMALNLLDGAAVAEDGIYGPKTAAAVLAYKRKRNIVNYGYQTQADDIVGKMTIGWLDAEMRVLMTRLLSITGGAGGRLGFLLATTLVTGAPTPKIVIVTEPDKDSVNWAKQVVAFYSKSGSATMLKVERGQTPAQIAAFYKNAASQAGTGGFIVISVGHGGADFRTRPDPDVGMVDLGPDNSFKLAGRGCTLVGDEVEKVRKPLTIPPNLDQPDYFHTEVFYADSPPKPYQSRKADDEQSGSQGAKVRLANWKAYEDISAAFKSQNLGSVVLLTCVVGRATGMLKKMAQQWGCGIWAYKRLTTISPATNGRERARFKEDMSEGTDPMITTNTPLSEVTPPPSRDDLVLITP